MLIGFAVSYILYDYCGYIDVMHKFKKTASVHLFAVLLF